MSVVFLRAARVGVFATDIGLKLTQVELRNHTSFLFVWFTLLCLAEQDPTTLSFIHSVFLSVHSLSHSATHAFSHARSGIQSDLAYKRVAFMTSGETLSLASLAAGDMRVPSYHTFVCQERAGVQRHLPVRDLSVCCHDVEMVSHSTSYQVS
jgi:hypothetical protein